MKQMLTRLVKEESGQGMTEYGLILGIIAIAIIFVLGTMSDSLKAVFSNISGALAGTTGTGTTTTP